MGARARGSRANGLGCESEEGFVERLACGLPEKKVARDWPVSQPSSGGQWWASGGQANGGRVCAGWVGFKGRWACRLFGRLAWATRGAEVGSAVDAEMVQRRGLRDSQMVVRGWPGRPSWVRPALLLHAASGRPAGAGFWGRCDWACWA